MQPSYDAIRLGLREPLIIAASSRYFKLKYLTLKLIRGPPPSSPRAKIEAPQQRQNVVVRAKPTAVRV
jgi:hypothetical protein